MNGSHTLEHFMNGVARDIEDPETKLSVWQRLRLGRSNGPRPPKTARKSASGRTCARRPWAPARIIPLSSIIWGLPRSTLGFDGEDGGGIYHSVYDDFYWFTHFSDTDFVYGRALSQTIGTAVMRLADADLLPFEFTDLADTIRMYGKELKKLASDERDAIHGAQQGNR